MKSMILMALITSTSAWSQWRPYVGFEGGYLKLNTDVASEIAKSGFQGGVKGLMGLSLQGFNMDAGLGWMYSNVSGQGATDVIDVVTKAGFVELAFRGRMSQIQLGVVSNYLIGSQLSFSETGVPVKSGAFLIGPQLLADFAESPSDLQLRTGLKVFTDLDIPDRRLIGALIELQLGFPEDQNAVSEVEPVAAPAPVVAEPAPELNMAPAVVLDNQSVRLTLDDAHVHFDLASSQVTAESKNFLNKFSMVLMNQENNWGKVMVDGHADKRGSFEFNEKLSLQRAKSVALVMTDAGIATNRMETRAHSFSKPIDPGDDEKALSRNRRVEIVVDGIKDLDSFKTEMKQILDIK